MTIDVLMITNYIVGSDKIMIIFATLTGNVYRAIVFRHVRHIVATLRQSLQIK